MVLLLALSVPVAPVAAQSARDDPLAARDDPLGPDLLAYCLDLGQTIDAADARLQDLTRRAGLVRAALAELRLRIGSLRDTARVDAAAATDLAALRLEWALAARALAETDTAIARTLVARRAAWAPHRARCAGRRFDDADRPEAETLRPPR